ncbi:MAG: MoaD/ThiS family protein [Ardenticatenaceae bacterium]
MTINVRLSVGLARLVGNPHLWVTLAEGATVADLFDHLRTEHPTLQKKLEIAVPVVSGRHATHSQALANGQQVAILIPIAGG